MQNKLTKNSESNILLPNAEVEEWGDALTNLKVELRKFGKHLTINYYRLDLPSDVLDVVQKVHAFADIVEDYADIIHSTTVNNTATQNQ